MGGFGGFPGLFVLDGMSKRFQSGRRILEIETVQSCQRRFEAIPGNLTQILQCVVAYR